MFFQQVAQWAFETERATDFVWGGGEKDFVPALPGGSPCLLHLSVEAPDEIASRYIAGGGKIIIPIEDRSYGMRERRVLDPA